MRIISGKYKGKRISPGKTFKARPTTDFAKEALFNILVNHFDFSSLKVLDLFAGTGSISYEFASRGAISVDSVELRRNHFLFIKDTAKTLNFLQMKIWQADAFKFIKKCTQKYELIFADPPYDLKGIESIPTNVFENDLLLKGGWFILEHSRNIKFNDNPNFFDHKSYGSVNFSFFKND